MIKYQIPTILQNLYRGVTWRRNSKERAIYLTFDDGCIPEVTPIVLNILDQYQIKATFFCVGENVAKYPELFAELKQRGHKIGCHTYNHLCGIRTSTKDYISNVEKANQLINSNLFRPPYGRITPIQKNILRKHFEIIMWDLITYDFDKNTTPETIFKNIQKYTRNGSIIVFHDSLKAQHNMLEVLPQIIKWWQKENYEFKLL